ncbi:MULTISPECIES: GNAT family N-acetyltransferase [Lactiplantibacillus]|uniref:N-acetyltransferase n=1 Tax=Lactiplantibacillus pentosus TaxID=1589 RepID=A0AB37BMR9_LACPE|nr:MULTISPECIES: GNAT family N-acetyltransferase [Lactiplantibacillus]MCM8607341.1 GNAT family N-acetyltransferase [Lactiplantibacillus sp. B652]PRO95856.1 N-acetyltransferase [Lactiplantibacillus pentosus]RMW46820.1 GNAT family N-acetyltransferase [Lactiplantibacillus pentosus]RMW47386.1 GNAT family N-acetyltransferase [Lactiplantibacillus pentosus]RMW49842.1 GNAT family N-acetyltransferase [Lactiplantibacillus pentosus]
MKLATLQAQLPDFEIRLLTLADQEDLLRLEQSNPQYHQYFSPEPLTMTEVQHDLTAHPDELAAAQKQVFGFYLAHRLVAVVDLLNQYPQEQFLFIGLLMVNRAYQRKSVGRIIVTGLMQAALASNIKVIQLTRVTADEGVARFWEGLGFEDGNQLFLPLRAGGRLPVTTMSRLLQ